MDIDTIANKIFNMALDGNTTAFEVVAYITNNIKVSKEKAKQLDNFIERVEKEN